MFDSTKSRECISGLIGWKDHYDAAEIPAFTDVTLKDSESGEYYQEKHPAMRLDLIKACLPDNRDLEAYLKETEEAAITELLNDVSVEKQLRKVGKDIVTNDVIYNSEGFAANTIINEGRFVGVRFRPVLNIGLKAQINRIALQLTEAQADLKLYLYHSHKAKKLAEITYTTTQGNQFNWIEANIEMLADDKDLSGGSFYLGYYQDDLTGQAIKYEKLNWRTGYCASCDGGAKQNKYTAVAIYVNMQAFYVPAPNLGATKDDIFDIEAIVETDENNWGFNFNITVKCDLTNFWCDNRMTLKHALGLKMTYKVLKDMSFSSQINYIEEQLKMMIVRDLEGDTETKYVNLATQYTRALRALQLDQGGINQTCLPCSTKSGVEYGTM